MARFRVIILEQEDTRIFRYALWADAPAARQSFFADASRTSVWKQANAADNLALQNGSVIERTDKLVMPAGSTIAQARQALQDVWQQFQNGVTNDNPWVRYGSTWDGTTWVAGGVT